MEKQTKLLSLVAIAFALSACATIDEDRYASLACKDMTALMAMDNLSAMSRPSDYLYEMAEDRDQRGVDVNWLSQDEKRRAELRASFRNKCK